MNINIDYQLILHYHWIIMQVVLCVYVRRESLVLLVPLVAQEPPVCRECLVSVELLVCLVPRERE